MYLRYYGLRERPFKLTSNPRCLLLTPPHQEALSALEYGLATRIGIMVLVGEAGTGKTTVVRAALSAQPPDGRFVTITNPILSREDFFRHLSLGFGLDDSAAMSKTAFLGELTRTLERSVAGGEPAGLVVDEAHTAPFEILEEVRLLSNLETDDDKLLPVILAGQPELAGRLNQPELRQLKQRVAVRATLGALDRADTSAYVAGRIELAGGRSATIFTRDAIDVVHDGSRGLPRSINVICENALVAGFATDERPIGAATVREVCGDLDLAVRAVDTGSARHEAGLAQAVTVGSFQGHIISGGHAHEPLR